MIQKNIFDGYVEINVKGVENMLIEINNYNSISFIIDKIILDQYTSFGVLQYSLNIIVKKDENIKIKERFNSAGTSGRFNYSGTEEQLLNYMKTTLLMDKFLGEDYKLEVTEKCFNDFQEKLHMFKRFTFDKSQKKVFKLCEKRGFKLYYGFSFADFENTFFYEFILNDLKISLYNHGCRIYVNYINSDEKTRHHPLNKSDHDLIISFLKTGEIPISTNQNIFNNFLVENKNLFEQNVIINENNNKEYSVIGSICSSSLKSADPRLYSSNKINNNIMTFNIDTLSNKGIDILPLLLKLLKIKREQIKIKNYFKGIKT